MITNWKLIAEEYEGTYLNNHKEGTGRTDSGLSRRENTGDLGNLQNLNERVQRRDSTIAPFWLRGLCGHR
jgi:hypothetical protein